MSIPDFFDYQDTVPMDTLCSDVEEAIRYVNLAIDTICGWEDFDEDTDELMALSERLENYRLELIEFMAEQDNEKE